MKVKKKSHITEIKDYDNFDTTSFIKPEKALKFEDLGLILPQKAPTQVVSIRLPTDLLNEIKAFGSQQDIPYQALIKLFLKDSLKRMKSKLF